MTWAHIWPSKRLNRAVIRLNVEVSENCFRITEPGLWPRGVKCRPWLTNNTYKNTFLNPSRSKSYRGSDNDYHNDSTIIIIDTLRLMMITILRIGMVHLSTFLPPAV